MKSAKRVRVREVDPKKRRKIRCLVRKHRLDRRRVYCVGMFGELATFGFFTAECSGCSCDCGDGFGCNHGCSGCHECGYTGRRRESFPEPVKVGDGYLQIEPAVCGGCNRPIAHFDAGCTYCAPDSPERMQEEAERDRMADRAEGEVAP